MPIAPMDDELLFRALTGQTDGSETAAVRSWAAESPRNEQRMRETSELLILAAESDDARRFGAGPAGDVLLRQREEQARARRRRRVRRFLLGTAAAAAVLVALRLPVRDPGQVSADLARAGYGPSEFVTEAEPATAGLQDGTVVRLGPQSRLRVEDAGVDRAVTLAGRGYFAVTHNPQAPFTIRTVAGTITVLGTRFDVTVTGDDLRVIVVEGSVRLSVRGSSVVVGAGQLAQVIRGNIVAPVDVPDPTLLLGWVGNFIAFQDTPLRTVAREIELLHGVRMHFSEPALEDRAVTAMFAGRTYEEIIEVVCVVANLRCVRDGDDLRVSPAQ